MFFIDDDLVQKIYHTSYASQYSYEQFLNTLIRGFELLRIKKDSPENDDDEVRFSLEEIDTMRIALEYNQSVLKAQRPSRHT